MHLKHTCSLSRNICADAQRRIRLQAYNTDTMSFDLPDTDMVYVTGLPTNVTIDEVAEHFGSIGELLRCCPAWKNPTHRINVDDNHHSW